MIEIQVFVTSSGRSFRYARICLADFLEIAKGKDEVNHRTVLGAMTDAVMFAIRRAERGGALGFVRRALRLATTRRELQRAVTPEEIARFYRDVMLFTGATEPGEALSP